MERLKIVELLLMIAIMLVLVELLIQNYQFLVQQELILMLILKMQMGQICIFKLLKILMLE